MAIEYRENRAIFKDIVGVDEAEGLLEWLQKTAQPELDLAGLEHLHTACLQVIMAASARVVGLPEKDSIRRWIEWALNN